MTELQYWEECILLGAEECNLNLNAEQLNSLATSAMGGHENYDLAFYSPHAIDLMRSFEKAHQDELSKLKSELNEYQIAAGEAIRKSLKLPVYAKVQINKDGSIVRND
jgi:hypothetical protein